MEKFKTLVIIVLCILLLVVIGLYEKERREHQDDVAYWANIVYEKDAEINKLNEKEELKISLEYVKNDDEKLEEVYDNIYVFSGNVTATINDEENNLKEALEKGIITVNDIFNQIEKDASTGVCKSIYNKYEDGTIEYSYPEYSIVKIYSEEKENYTDLVIATDEDLAQAYSEKTSNL